MTEIRKAATHNGTFHPDDVFSSAVLQKIYPAIEIIRTRDPEEIATADLVFDVGRQYDPAAYRFDHHQPGAPVRPNDIAYSAFGLLWLEYGVAYCGGDADVAQAVDERLVQVVDANDNGTQIRTPNIAGVEPFEVFDVLYNYNPRFGSPDEEYDVQFGQAVKVASGILDRLVMVEESNKILREYFAQQYEQSADSRYVVLDEAGDYKKVATQYTGLLYFVSPDKANDTWGVTAVSLPEDVFALKAPLPAEWAGKEAQELVQLTGVPDAQFCHLKRFLAVAQSRDGAMALLEQAILNSEGV